MLTELFNQLSGIGLQPGPLGFWGSQGLLGKVDLGVSEGVICHGARVLSYMGLLGQSLQNSSAVLHP